MSLVSSALSDIVLTGALSNAVGAAVVEGENALPFPPIVFALIATAVFAALGFVVWSYRDVANRQGKKDHPSAGHGADHH